MKKLYSSPFRVYLIILVLAVIGIVAGTKLQVSLYPNSSKPTIQVSINYGHLNKDEFVQNYGNKVGPRLQAISSDSLIIKEITTIYRKTSAGFKTEFDWGTDPIKAKREVQNIMNAVSASWPREIKDSINVHYWSKSSGFIAISFFSEKRDIDNLYKTLEPALVPKLASVQDAENPSLWNPGSKEVSIVLNPEAVTSLRIFPRHIEQALRQGVQGYLGGTVVVDNAKLSVQMPRYLNSLESLQELLVQTPTGRIIHLSEIAEISIGEAIDSNNIFKTNGSKSLMLFAKPKSGGNVKRMAEQILQIVKEAMPNLPKDIQYKVLVDPSEFIRSSINNVIHEVFLAASLAVFVLFLFVGSIKNTITAALEIPLSMVLAFILMNIFDMNLNLISLGGLALAAGMNVDASVVIMENIFRNLNDVKGPLNFKTRLALVLRSVKEVRLPIIASTISTLVVFAPIAFTSNLTNAILGDLAKAVVYSHFFSMFIALILVPTIRLHIMNSSKDGDIAPISPINGTLLKLEALYEKGLRFFIKSKTFKICLYFVMVAFIAGVALYTVPKLKREIIGTPDTDWMILSVSTQGNTLIKQMEEIASKEEARLLEKFSEEIRYTFTQIQAPNRTTIMARLKNKNDMSRVWKKMEEEFQNSPIIFYWVGPWNPAELPLPNPPHMRLVVQGGATEDRVLLAKDIADTIRESEAFPRTWTNPGSSKQENIIMEPHFKRWPLLSKIGVQFTPFDLIDLTRVATDGKKLGHINLNSQSIPVKLSFPKGIIASKEDLESFPIAVQDRFIPLKSLSTIKIEQAKSNIYKVNNRELIYINGKQKKGQEDKIKASLAKVKAVVKDYRKNDLHKLKLKSAPIFYFEDTQKSLKDALKQLSLALVLAALLIFITLLLQFGDLIHSLIIMIAAPLGILGGLLSLYIFDSTICLNSILGIILLNGIAVNNSIILVDFITKLHSEGITPLEAAILASKKRLRPILITSLTTILGMLPIALGLGDGGKILQPLGLSVAGGLWFSMFFTLFLVPTFEVFYLTLQDRFKAQDILLDDSLKFRDTAKDINNLNLRKQDISDKFMLERAVLAKKLETKMLEDNQQ
ncbi:MAG: efflux RND transporter permease subunit [Bacteriovoracaceae bacterium]|jgi:hydrophobic/amphiphilic exporter-1 (mainly G- bacteria), HAE1 family|nr:efflux RND transporter permease subunit [Bacteriovoracaceae bacterium]